MVFIFRILASLVLMLVASYCGFGLLATLQPGIGQVWLWRILYAGLGAVALIVIGILIWHPRVRAGLRRDD